MSKYESIEHDHMHVDGRDYTITMRVYDRPGTWDYPGERDFELMSVQPDGFVATAAELTKARQEAEAMLDSWMQYQTSRHMQTGLRLS